MLFLCYNYNGDSMRTFNYVDDHSRINIDVKSYINELIKELTYLIEIEGLDVYKNGLEVVNNFKNKYSDLHAVHKEILEDLLKPENVEYAVKNKKYKDDASKIGIEFQKDLYRIFELEESLSKLAEKQFENMTPFDQIENGGEFMVVGHVSHQLPGVSNNPNYIKNQKEYLSCSLFSNNEQNTFDNGKIVYLVDVTEDNYISASYFDVAARESRYPSIYSLKEVETETGKEYISIGYTYDSDKFALSIATPKVVEKLSLERESNIENPLTNEIVLLRGKTISNKALLMADETDLLLDEFVTLRKNNIEFKCINKGLYKEQKDEDRYDKTRLIELKNELSKIGYYDKKVLEDYYKNVVLKMNYSDDILEIINDGFSKYIDIENIMKEPKEL